MNTKSWKIKEKGENKRMNLIVQISLPQNAGIVTEQKGRLEQKKTNINKYRIWIFNKCIDSKFRAF